MSKHPIPDSALDADIAILGKKGRGKTYTAKGIVERLLKLKRRVLILDPLSTWWGLRASADGLKPGFPIAVFGGPHADVEISDKSGRALGKLLAKENLPAVIDMGGMRKAEQNRLVADLLDELFAKNREPLTLVLEEADAFAPQTPMKDESARVLGEVDRIARRGRAYGFRLISITQRPAKLNKDVLTQLSVLVALGVTSPQDRDAIKAWVEGNADRDKAKEVYNSLAGLGVGEGWIWAPDDNVLKRVQFPAIQTLDTSFTPRAGERRAEPKTLAQVDVSALREALQDVPVKVQHGIVTVSTHEIEKAMQEGRAIGHKQGFAEGFEEALKRATKAINFLTLPGEDITPAPPAEKRNIAPGKAQITVRREDIEKPNLGAERRPLAALAGAYPAGMTESQWALATGMKRTGGSWGTYKSRLRTRGLIEQRDGLWYATAQGVTAAGNEVELLPQTAEARVEFWAKKIGGGSGRMLQLLAKMYPHGANKNDMADVLEMKASGGSFGTYISRLRANGLIEKRGDLFYATKSLMEDKS